MGRSQGLFQNAIDRQRRLAEGRHGPRHAVGHRWIGTDGSPLVLPKVQIAPGQILHRGRFVAFAHHFIPVYGCGGRTAPAYLSA